MTERKVSILLAALLLLAVLCIAWMFLPRNAAALLPFPVDAVDVDHVVVTVAPAPDKGGAYGFELTAEERQELQAILREEKVRLLSWPANDFAFRDCFRIFHITPNRPGGGVYSLSCLEDGRIYIGNREYRMESNAAADFMAAAVAAKADSWSSFTWKKAFSHDGVYYVLQSTEEIDGVPHVVVSVYRAEDDGLVDSFVPARAWDFWGVCWERDSYRIWTHSWNVGVRCYEYTDGKWEMKPAAVRPEYIRTM